MRNNSKVLALSTLVLASLSFGASAADAKQSTPAVTTLKTIQVMHINTLNEMQALNYNMRRRHIDLRNDTLMAKDDNSQIEDTTTVQVDTTESTDAVE